jgi:hypothetical protein
VLLVQQLGIIKITYLRQNPDKCYFVSLVVYWGLAEEAIIIEGHCLQVAEAWLKNFNYFRFNVTAELHDVLMRFAEPLDG